MEQSTANRHLSSYQDLSKTDEKYEQTYGQTFGAILSGHHSEKV